MSHWQYRQTTSRLLFQPWFRWTRGMTLGVRAMVVDEKEFVLLVRHSYSPGWQFPGGGVERGETAVGSLERELEEEAAVHLAGRPQLFGLYSNEAHFRGDHVAFYIVREFTFRRFTPTREIVAAQFFALDRLPVEATEATLRRIDEVKGALPIGANW